MSFISFSWLMVCLKLLVVDWIKTVGIDANAIGLAFCSYIQYDSGYGLDMLKPLLCSDTWSL